MSRDDDAEARLRSVRALIADRMLAADPREPPLGDVVLRPDQLADLARLRALLARHRGAMLAEEAGVGKTYVAAAVARRYREVVVVAPASLRAMWEAALRRTSVSARFHSVERLGRAHSTVKSEDVSLVVVDEAHHLRTPSTRRYAAVAALCDRAAVLLISATPVQNRRDDLSAQLALFLGDAAWTMNDGELAGFVIRRAAGGLGGRLPVVEGPHWIHLPSEDDVLDALVDLPPPVPGADEGNGGTLVMYGLLRQWASSRAAFVEALRRRIARAAALCAALECGRWPTRRELAVWNYADGAMQLAFPELIASDHEVGFQAALLPAVRRHESALVALLTLVRQHADPDDARANALRDIRGRHVGARILAFSEYRETVRALARRLLADGGIAELTATSARVVGGRVTRHEVLAQLAPGAAAPSAGERIEMVVTTDVLSEGLDLQGASVVVHLDLPWNPARLEQRVGRVRRIGSPHATVWTYALAPPAASERVLRVEERLRRKLRLAGRIIGSGVAVLPSISPFGQTVAFEARTSAAEATSDALGMLSTWHILNSGTPPASAEETRHAALAAVVAPHEGFLALLEDESGPLLLADAGGGPTLDAHVVAQVARLAAGRACRIGSEEAESAIANVAAWWAERRGRRSLTMHSPSGSRVRARLSARIDALLLAVARHDRARVGELASRARVALRVPLPIARERALTTHATAATVDESWLRDLVTIAAERATPIHRAVAGIDDTIESNRSLSSPSSLPLVALVLLRHAAPADDTLSGQRGSAQAAHDEARPRPDTER